MAKILMVDDDPVVSTAVRDALRSVNHECTVAANSAQAFHALKSEPFDLMILDIMLPGVSGFEVCRRVHSDPMLYALPILMLSAMDGDEEVSHGLAQGADDYVSKPFRMEVLMARIENLLNSSHTPLVDPLTSLPGPRFVRLELQKAINLRAVFALLYIELRHITEYARAVGPDARNALVRHLAQLLQARGREMNDALFRVGHMGGGHFVSLHTPELAQPYGEKIAASWNAHLATPGVLPAPVHGKPALAVPEVLIGLTHARPSGHQTVGDYFDILSHLRAKALASNAAGIYCDQRM